MLDKLFSEMKFYTPGRRIYFIYTHDNAKARFKNGLKANTEISHFCAHALRAHFPNVLFLRLKNEKSRRIATIRPQDIVIGHIEETWFAASKRTRRLIGFAPWCGYNGCMPYPQQEELAIWDRAAAMILLTSEFNKRTYFEEPKSPWYTPFKSYAQRLRIVHQPIDLNVFKRIKHTYTTNNFLYIGHKGYMKCIEDAITLVNTVGRTLTLYGVEQGKSLNNLDENAVSKLPHLADFFIQPGLWEAQCVSILEAAARGFIPVVSKETGYPYDHPFLLKPKDVAYNTQVLKDLLHTSSDERKKLADKLHVALVEDLNHNNWNKLTDVLVEEVRKLCD